MKKPESLRILYLNAIETNAGWGAECFMDRGFRNLGHSSFCVDFRKHRAVLHKIVKEAPEYDVFFLQRGDFVPLEVIASARKPRLFWASELVSRCRDQDPLLKSGLFDHVFFHSQDCVRTAVSKEWLQKEKCSVLLNGFDETVHRPLPRIAKDIDVLFVGNITPRRRKILDRIEPLFHVTVVPAFGEELVRCFNRSRIILNLHAEDFPDTETRVFEALGCGAFLLSERLSEDNPFTDEHLVQVDTMDDLCGKISFYLQNEAEREEIASKGYREALMKHTYKNRAAEIATLMRSLVLRSSWTPNAADPPGSLGPFGRPPARNARPEDRVRLSAVGIDTEDRNQKIPAAQTDVSDKKGSPPVNTKDDWTYYRRVGKESAEKKTAHIRDFVLSQKEKIGFLLDVGCNNGQISAQFIPHGIKVLGLDASNRLRHPAGYEFLQCDISQSNQVIFNDCTLFLSLYHHLFNALGMEQADQLFYRLLLRTKFLIFDTGNPEEKGEDREHWKASLREKFSSERELLDHFGLPYYSIGKWETGGTTRTIVVFESRSFDDQVGLIEEFRRKVGSINQPLGIFTIGGSSTAQEDFFEKTHFYKLRLNNRTFFGKKHLIKEWETSELGNLVEVYRRFPKEELLQFYGVSGRYGLIYEWLEDFKYRGKLRDQCVHGLLLHDADLIEVNGRIKYIDFWSDPANRPHRIAPFGSAEQLVREGEAAYAAGAILEAGKRFQEALEKNPGQWEAMNNLGVIAFEFGDLDTAQSLLLKAHDLCPSHPETIENLALCHEKKGEYGEALKWFRRVFETGAPSVEILNKTGNCLVQMEDFEAAREVYEESLRRDGTQEKVRSILKAIRDLTSLRAPSKAGTLDSGLSAGSGRNP